MLCPVFLRAKMALPGWSFPTVSFVKTTWVRNTDNIKRLCLCYPWSAFHDGHENRKKSHLWPEINRHAYVYKAPTTAPVWVTCRCCRPLDSSVGSYTGLSQHTMDCSKGDIFRDGTASFFKWLAESRGFLWLALIITFLFLTVSNCFLPHFPVLSLLKDVVDSNSGRILLTDFCDISRSVEIWRWDFKNMSF